MTAKTQLNVGDCATLVRTLTAEEGEQLRQLAGGDDAFGAADLLVAALWSTLLGMELPGPGANYLKQETRLLAPIPYGEVLTARVQITRLRLDKGLVDLHTTCHNAHGVLVAEGRALVQARDTGRLPAS